MKQKIIEKEIVKDIARGMADSELTQKYNLSEDQLRSIFKQLANSACKENSNVSQRPQIWNGSSGTHEEISAHLGSTRKFSQQACLRQMLSLQPNSRLSVPLVTNTVVVGAREVR